jgi:hypothetical protein
VAFQWRSNALTDCSNYLARVWSIVEFIQLETEQVRTRGLQVPDGIGRSGIYLLTFANGDRYLGRTSDIILRLGGHRRTYDNIASAAFCPVPRGELESVFAEFQHQVGPLSRIRVAEQNPIEPRALTPTPDPFLERIRWIEENVPESDNRRLAEPPDQRERTCPLYQRLAAHPEFDVLRTLVARYLERVIPAPVATERRNWVITSMPSTARTRVWHRLLCLSVNNVEALTIGEQFDGERWIVVGFMSAAATDRSEDRLIPAVARRNGAFICPAFYRTVGEVSQVGFDSLLALRGLLESERILDLVSELVMRLMKRGTGMYARFHDYNLADVVLNREAGNVISDRG